MLIDPWVGWNLNLEPAGSKFEHRVEPQLRAIELRAKPSRARSHGLGNVPDLIADPRAKSNHTPG